MVEISLSILREQEAIMEGHGQPGQGCAGEGGNVGGLAPTCEGISHPSRTLTDLGLFKDYSCRS